MPFDAASIFSLAGIVLAFMLFGGALMWADFKTRNIGK